MCKILSAECSLPLQQTTPKHLRTSKISFPTPAVGCLKLQTLGIVLLRTTMRLDRSRLDACCRRLLPPSLSELDCRLWPDTWMFHHTSSLKQLLLHVQLRTHPSARTKSRQRCIGMIHCSYTNYICSWYPMASRSQWSYPCLDLMTRSKRVYVWMT